MQKFNNYSNKVTLKLSLPLFTLLLFLQTLAYPANIEISLIVTNSNYESKTIIFGFDETATDSIDGFLGESPLPPLPPTAIMDVRFQLPCIPAEYSELDFRNNGNHTAKWIILLQSGSGGYPIHIKWEKIKLPAGSFNLRDRITGEIINIDMKMSDSLEIASSGFTSVEIMYKSQISLYDDNRLRLRDGSTISLYPNPVISIATVDLSIPTNDNYVSYSEQTHITVDVYDLLGVYAGKLLDEFVLADRYQFRYNFSKYKSGTYLIVYKTNNVTAVRKFVVIK